MRKERLGDLCTIVSGGTPARSNMDFWNGGDIPWIKISNIKGKYVTEADEYITQAGLDNSSAKMLSQGTILYTIFATLGEVGILDFDACTNQAIAGITIKDTSRLLTDYLYYYLKAQKNYVAEIGRGVAQNNINMSILRNFEVPLPAMQEQHAIVELINHVEMIIQVRKRQLRALDTLIKARFVEMFGDRWSNDKEWPISTLEKVADFYNGKPHEQVIDENGEYVLVTSRCIASEGQDVRRTKELLFPLRTGDICMVMSDVPNGKALAKCMFIDCDGKYSLNQRICCFRNYRCNPRFLFYLLNRHEYFLSYNDGDSQTNLRKGDLLACPMIIPPLELQDQFAAFVSQVDKSKAVVRKALEEAQLLFDSLMQKYFN